MGPGIEPASSWVLVRFVTAEPQRELPESSIFKKERPQVDSLTSYLKKIGKKVLTKPEPSKRKELSLREINENHTKTTVKTITCSFKRPTKLTTLGRPRKKERILKYLKSGMKKKTSLRILQK